MSVTRAKWLGLLLSGGATVIAACSSQTIIDDGFGPVGVPGGVGAIGSASASGPTSPPRCPVDPPKTGDSCVDLDVTCTYGPDVRDECAEKYECAGYRWREITGTCQIQCPNSHDEITVGSACGDHTMACSYDEGTCGCVHDGPLPVFDGGTGDASTSGADAGDAGDGGDGGKEGGAPKPLVPGVWKCVAPPTDPACPSTRPRVLDECVKQVICDYGTCELRQDLRYACMQRWQPSFDEVDCP